MKKRKEEFLKKVKKKPAAKGEEDENEVYKKKLEIITLYTYYILPHSSAECYLLIIKKILSSVFRQREDMCLFNLQHARQLRPGAQVAC